MKIELDINPRVLVNCLVNATHESHYWCERLELPTPLLPKAKAETGWDGRGWTQFWNDPTACFSVYHDGGEKPVVVSYTLAKSRLRKFFNTRHGRDLLNENDDAVTADVLLQIITLGEIVYG